MLLATKVIGYGVTANIAASHKSISMLCARQLGVRFPVSETLFLLNVQVLLPTVLGTLSTSLLIPPSKDRPCISIPMIRVREFTH